MNPEQLREYYRKKTKEWRIKNPARNKILRKKYKESEKGKIANQRYFKKYIGDNSSLGDYKNYMRAYQRKRYLNHPEKYKQSKEYIKNYMAKYILDLENHRKFLIRQKDRHVVRKQLLRQKGYCELCGSEDNLEIHHKIYDESRNIILLCRKCHRTLHRKR